MVKLRAFIFDTIMHLYWGYLQGRNYASINNVLKVMNFLKNSHFALFFSFDIHVKNTNFTFGIPHTHIQIHTDTYRYHFQILHFLANLVYMPNIFGIPQTYTCTDTQTYVQRHWHTDTDTLRHMQVCKHMHVCIHKQTHTHWCVCGESKEIVTSKALAR